MKKRRILILSIFIIFISFFAIRRLNMDGKFVVNDQTFYYSFKQINLREIDYSNPLYHKYGSEPNTYITIYNKYMQKIGEKKFFFNRFIKIINFETHQIDDYEIYTYRLNNEDAKYYKNIKELHALYMNSIVYDDKEDIDDVYTKSFAFFFDEKNKLLLDDLKIIQTESIWDYGHYVELENNDVLERDYNKKYVFTYNSVIYNVTVRDRIYSDNTIEVTLSNDSGYEYDITFETPKDKIVTLDISPEFEDIYIDTHKCILTKFNYYTYDPKTDIVQKIVHYSDKLFCPLASFDTNYKNKSIEVIEEFKIDIPDYVKHYIR